MYSKIDGTPRVDNADLGLLRRWLALVRFPLAKIGYGQGRLPEWVIERPVELWSMRNGNRLCIATRWFRLAWFRR